MREALTAGDFEIVDVERRKEAEAARQAALIAGMRAWQEFFAASGSDESWATAQFKAMDKAHKALAAYIAAGGNLDE